MLLLKFHDCFKQNIFMYFSYSVVGGEGIKEGTAGQPVTFHLDGRNAGPGQLSCRCRAPSGKMTYVLISDNKVFFLFPSLSPHFSNL